MEQNRRLYDAAADLSLMPTIARIAVRSSSRCTARSITCWSPTASGCSASPGRATRRIGWLDAILFDDLDAVAQRARGQRIGASLRCVTGLDAAARLAGVIRYRRVSTPEMFEQPLAPALAHLFNHQTASSRPGAHDPDKPWPQSAGARPAVFPAHCHGRYGLSGSCVACPVVEAVRSNLGPLDGRVSV